ncbi:MAG: hypothetical protein KatS3mg101_1113 [Patescibacteria group bacterium]|nr:MAG: hypothetical protein KatS3mg101_1113 [Patescibacteria group bacterium]
MVFVCAQVFQFDLSDRAGIGKGRVAARHGHAVDDDFAGGRGCGNYQPTRAHAKRKHASVAHLAGQPVAGGRQVGASRFTTVLDAVDEGLRMFDAHAEGEGLRLDDDMATVQQLVNVAGRVASGEDDGRGGVLVVVVDHDALHHAVVEDKIRHPAVEMDFSAMVQNGLADVGHDVGQLVGTDVGVGVDEDVAFGTVFDQQAKHLEVVAPFVGSGVKLAVGVGAGTAFAEAVVRIRIDFVELLDGSQVAAPLAHVFASVENDGPQSQFDEFEGGEVASWACADDDDRRAVTDVAEVGQQGRLGGRRASVHVEPEPVQGAMAACIDAALDQLDLVDLLFAEASQCQHLLPQELLGEGLFGCQCQFDGVLHLRRDGLKKRQLLQKKTFCNNCRFIPAHRAAPHSGWGRTMAVEALSPERSMMCSGT